MAFLVVLTLLTVGLAVCTFEPVAHRRDIRRVRPFTDFAATVRARPHQGHELVVLALLLTTSGAYPTIFGATHQTFLFTHFGL